MSLSGSYVALVTPFRKSGKIDTKALENMISWQIEEGTEGLILFGSTGEGIALTEKEKEKVLRLALAVSEKKIPIFAGTGSASTMETLRLTEKMARLGASGALVITPYYNKPSARGCIAHFKEVAKVGLPLILYHHPGRTNVRLSAETIATISQEPAVVALKDSSQDLELIRQVRSLCELPIFAGDDDQTLAVMREGGVGTISVIGNLLPRRLKQIISFANKQEWRRAEQLFLPLLPLCKALFSETNPQGIKWTMSAFGMIQNQLRLPLVPIEKTSEEAIQKEIIRLSLPFFNSELWESRS